VTSLLCSLLSSIHQEYCSIAFNLAPSMTVTSLLKVLFLQASDLAMTSKYFQQVGVKFVLEARVCANGLYQHWQIVKAVVSL